MRKLITQDLFTASRIIKSANIKEKLKEALKGDDDREKGVDAVMILLEACSDEKVENMLYSFLGSVMEEDAEKVKNLPITELFAAIKEMAAENDLKAFFQIASKSA